MITGATATMIMAVLAPMRMIVVVIVSVMVAVVTKLSRLMIVGMAMAGAITESVALSRLGMGLRLV